MRTLQEPWTLACERLTAVRIRATIQRIDLRLARDQGLPSGGLGGALAPARSWTRKLVLGGAGVSVQVFILS